MSLVLTGEALERWLSDAPEPCAPHIVGFTSEADRDGVRWYTSHCTSCGAVLDIHDERVERERGLQFFTELIEHELRPPPPRVHFVSPSMFRWLTAQNVKSDATTSARIEYVTTNPSGD